jgi:hypothetical protein
MVRRCCFAGLLQVRGTPVKRLCKTQEIITVNGQFPGPTIEVYSGDTLAVRAVNLARYNVTLHWHGLRQLRNGWADGPEFVTQCPIRPGGSYTYRFTVEGQEGTLWWHAHSSWLRATVHGALIIHPRRGVPYPFPKPHTEAPVILGTCSDTHTHMFVQYNDVCGVCLCSGVVEEGPHRRAPPVHDHRRATQRLRRPPHQRPAGRLAPVLQPRCERPC